MAKIKVILNAEVLWDHIAKKCFWNSIFVHSFKPII